MAKKMLIDATHPEETRVVVVDGNKVDDFDFESINKRQLAGNIYLAKVTRVEPSLQAAFVEYGGNRHGFLAFSEIHPDYYQIPVADREALLAEEAREEEARQAREDEHDGHEARSGRRRGRRRGRGDREERGENGDVAGLEVIDIDDEDDDEDGEDAGRGVPRGLEIHEPDALSNDEPAAGPLVSVEPVGSRRADKTAGRAEGAEEDAQEDAEVASADAGQADETDETQESASAGEAPAANEGDATPSDEDGEAPRTIAESTGLDDDERVVGEVEGGGDRTVSGNGGNDTLLAEPAEKAPSPAPAATEPAAAATGPVEAEVTDEDTGDDDSDDDGAETGAADDAGDDETDDASGDEESGDAERGGRRRGRRRGRRGRRDDKPAEEAVAGEARAQEAGANARPAARDADEDGTEDPDLPEQVGAEDTLEEAARARTRLRRRYKIQDVVKVRQIMLVQVVKEERGNKGAALTTYLSLAGRYCVLMPNTARGGGISRKITNAADRKRLREITGEMDVPQGMGLIVRTAGAERTKAEIKRDYEYLLRQWEQIRDLTLKSIAPTLIYEEGSLIKRSIRDIYNKDIEQILVEGDQGYREAKEYMKMLMPSHAKNVQQYTDPIPLFSRYQVESYLNGMFNPTVQLKSGGYIVIGVTEALVAIDVNSGRATKQGSIEETAVQTNLEAADEIARQLRLRDLAGLIVIDFIDMDENRNNRSVEKRMKDRLKNDRARIQVGRISAFGLMEMSRQRLRPGMLEATTQTCPTCHGTGLIRSDESLSLSILRELEEEGLRGRADELVLRAPIDVTNYLINSKRPHLAQIEARHGISISVMADPALTTPHFEIERSKSQKPRPARQQDVVTAGSVVTEEDLVEDAAAVEEREEEEDSRSRRRRGRRGGKRRRDEGPGEREEREESQAAPDEEAEAEAEGEDDDRPRRRRGRRRGGRNRRGDQAETRAGAPEDQDADEVTGEAAGAPSAEEATPEATTIAAPEADVAEVAAEAESVEPEPAEPEAVAESAPEAPVEEIAAADVAEDEQVAEEPAEEKAAEEAEEEAAATPEEPVVPPVAEPVAEKEPEAEPEPAGPPKPKRRGWWSLNR